MKIKELTNRGEDIYYICNGTDILPEKLTAEEEIEFVQHIGRVLVFYKHSDNIDNPIVLPIKK